MLIRYSVIFIVLFLIACSNEQSVEIVEENYAHWSSVKTKNYRMIYSIECYCEDSGKTIELNSIDGENVFSYDNVTSQSSGSGEVKSQFDVEKLFEFVRLVATDKKIKGNYRFNMDYYYPEYIDFKSSQFIDYGLSLKVTHFEILK